MLEDVTELKALLGRVQGYLPYGSQLWLEVARARGLIPQPRVVAPRTTAPGAVYPMVDAEVA